MTNTYSTDPFGAFPCYANDVTTKYLNKKEVKAAIGARSDLTWQVCK